MGLNVKFYIKKKYSLFPSFFDAIKYIEKMSYLTNSQNYVVKLSKFFIHITLLYYMHQGEKNQIIRINFAG